MTLGGPFGRAIGWLGGGVFASAVLQYILFFAVARWLGVAEYGAFSLALTAAILAAPFCDLGSSVSIVCTGSRRPDDLAAQLGGALLLRALMAVPVGLAALGVGLACGYGATFATLLPPLFVAALADGAGTLASAACQAEERMATAALLQVARNLLRGGALVVTLLAGGGPHALATTFGLASVVGAAVALRIAAHGRTVPLAWQHVRPTLQAALPFGAAILATGMQAQIGVLLLGWFDDESAVGRYHAALRFVLLLQMLPQVVAMASAPRAFRAGAGDPTTVRSMYERKLAALAPIGLLAALALATGSEWVVGHCLGSSFAGSAPLLLALAPVPFVKFVASALADTASALGRQRAYAVGCWLALGLQVAAALALIPRFGPVGVAGAVVASETFLLLFLASVTSAAGVPVGLGRALRPLLWAAAAAAFAAASAGPWAAVPAAAIGLLAQTARRLPRPWTASRAPLGGAA
ncbi:MAG: oligosaccharide flippase family protein [Planctomycetes bacterium]|nr:oligosaccharide flippase family protein [Planctomycetota bacterium]